MKCRLLNFLTVLSLLLCVAIALLWARSYNVRYELWRGEFDSVTSDERYERIVVASGRISIWIDHLHHPVSEEYLSRGPGWRLYRDPYWYAFRYDMGFRVWFTQVRPLPAMTSFGPAGTRAFGVNLLVPVALAALLPVTWRVRHLRAHRRIARGQCRRCGYDLRASPERCPECAAVTKSSEKV